MITGKNQIGNTLSSKGTKTFTTFNPELHKENPWIFYEASNDEVLKAIELAKNAFVAFQTISNEQKASFLNTIANEILALGDELIKTYCLESGLPEGRAQGERGRTIFQLQSFAKLVAESNWVDAIIDEGDENRQPIPKPDLRKMNIPLGTIAIFGASNFPLAYSTAGGDTASALAAGCPVIVKSHPMHAGTGELVASAVIKAAEKTNMPNGIFSNLNSSGIEIGQLLVQHPDIKAVGFTGSIKGGRSLFDLAAKRKEPIPVFAEMGSINPVVLLPKALQNDAQQWATTYANSITLGTGQFCTNPGLLLGIKSDELSNFVNILADKIVEINPTCMLHPNIKRNYDTNKQQMLIEKNIKIDANLKDSVPVNYAQQAVLSVDGTTFLQNPTLHQEVFGPFSLIVHCDDVHQLETIIQNLEGQLTGTIISDTSELSDYQQIISALQSRVGRIIFNGVPTGVEVCEAMMHGGPYPASTDSRFTAVGVNSIKRWVRPFSYQNWPNQLLPKELQNENPLQILRKVNGNLTKDAIV